MDGGQRKRIGKGILGERHVEAVTMRQSGSRQPLVDLQHEIGDPLVGAQAAKAVMWRRVQASSQALLTA